MKLRMYLVKVGDAEFLVNANSRAAAIRAAFQSMGTTVEMAGQYDIARLVAAGNAVIEATPQGELDV